MWTCRPSSTTASDARRRASSAGASSSATPNFASPWPVDMAAWVSPATSGLTRRSTRMGAAGASASSRRRSSALSITTQPTPAATAVRSSLSSLALPWR